jgi:predicted O-methyltransferase YrrM
MFQKLKAIAKKILRVIRALKDMDELKAEDRKFYFWLAGGGKYNHNFYNASLSQAFAGHFKRSDISDHLGSIFFFALEAKPKLIVELGTRGGESTRSLLAAAFLSKAVLLSIDIEECGYIDLPFRENWHFIQADDIEFGNSQFVDWCRHRHLEPIIDVLFIDTSHEYEHTKNEIKTWYKYLSEEGVMIFHDTNMGKGIYSRTDGSIDFGWDNERGVIKAIEEFVGRNYDEKSFFYDFIQDICILHYPYCNGLTILKRHNLNL